jgi:XTP/dITP diphosphohydrolase
LTAARTILIATGNRGKLREISEIMADVPVRWLTLSDFPGIPAAVEDADSFAGNAALKARHYSNAAGIWTLADDSGLEVDALDGAPGVHSARYAGSPRDAAANNQKLIRDLSGVDLSDRTARFRCAVALADGDRVLATAEGTVEGRVIDEPRGHNGFGYDPHFWVLEHGMTAAQMPSALKNSISHRGRALAALKPRLIELLDT